MFGLFSTKRNPGTTPLRLFNTRTRKKEIFAPLSDKEVTLYSCGPTVYDNATIGNLRSYTFADTLKRTLTYNGYTVIHTMNLTDFGHLSDDGDNGEDKMMKTLGREGLSINLENMLRIAHKYGEQFKQDMFEMHNIAPTQYTPASEYVDEQITLIQQLSEKGYTYETSDGVYFDISKCKDYGELGNVNLEKLKEGARVEVNKEKRHPADFALWKKAELGWESGWGKGFPGWHTECTAMIFATLGEQIDIHTGGEDLVYTHHNGEIAQAEAASGKRPYVRYWMHNAFITIDNERLGKSVGNAITLADLKEKGYSPLSYRYWLLTAHYRSPANFTYDALDGASEALRKLQEFVVANHEIRGTVNEPYQERFTKAINDDLNTPQALALVWELVKDDAVAAGDRVETLRDFDNVLGLGLFENIEMLKGSLGHIEKTNLPKEITDLLKQRQEARNVKDFETADTIRNKLKEMGYLVEDRADGQQVKQLT